jgi:hypothetical protein
MGRQKGVENKADEDITMTAASFIASFGNDAVCEVVPRVLLMPIEADGPSMIDIIAALKADAAAQENMATVVGRVLDKTVQLNDAKGAGNTAYGCSLPLFHSTHKCPLKPSAYVQRILEYSDASPCTIVLATVYMQRLKSMGGNGATDTKLRLTSYNIQRLLLTATALACKMYDEPYASNKQWAAIGDLTMQEMNALELELLFAIKFSLVVSREEYDKRHAVLLEIDQAYYPSLRFCKSPGDERPRVDVPEEALHEAPVPQGPQTPSASSCADSDEHDDSSRNSSRPPLTPSASPASPWADSNEYDEPGAETPLSSASTLGPTPCSSSRLDPSELWVVDALDSYDKFETSSVETLISEFRYMVVLG